jgi:hypothetical protein
LRGQIKSRQRQLAAFLFVNLVFRAIREDESTQLPAVVHILDFVTLAV